VKSVKKKEAEVRGIKPKEIKKLLKFEKPIHQINGNGLSIFKSLITKS